MLACEFNTVQANNISLENPQRNGSICTFNNVKIKDKSVEVFFGTVLMQYPLPPIKNSAIETLGATKLGYFDANKKLQQLIFSSYSCVANKYILFDCRS
jgi:hypothetical protein